VSPYQYNSSNELTSTPSGSYTYDNNGNRKTDPSGSQYTWDLESRLTQMVLPGTSGTVNFKYDPFGRRIYKNTPNFTGTFVYDGDDLIETLNSSGAVVARYTQTQSIDEPLAEVGPGGTNYYEADGLGSITSLISSAGSVANSYTYDSFGNLTALTGSLSNPLRYTGREFDTATSLYFYRARYYDPATGRFISEDPIGFSGDGTNFYIYVDNDPVILIDPLGLVHCIGGANCNFTPPMRDALACFDRCTHLDNAVTSGRRSGGGQHGNGQACDMNRADNRSLSRPVVEQCVRQCFPNGYSQEEHNSPTYHLIDPDDPGTHWHLQLNTVPGGQPGVAPTVRPYQPSPPR
jgi:RHS repeat-associated protein